MASRKGRAKTLNTVSTGVRLPRPCWVKLGEIAEREDVPVNRVVRWAVESYLSGEAASNGAE